MQKTFVVLFVLFVLIVGFMFFTEKGKLEAPTIGSGDITVNTDNIEGTPMPIIGPSDTTVPEMIVNESNAKEFIIDGTNFSFSPNTITVNGGDQVRIIFKNTSGFHDFKIDEFNVSTKQMQSPYQEILEFTADKTGAFQYYCSVGSHRAMGMFGTLTVK